MGTNTDSNNKTMLFCLPEEYKTVEEIYGKIECYGGMSSPRGGQYPIGRNHYWHNGIHIHGCKAVYPIIDGVITACRLTDTFATIPKHPDIGKDEFNRLSILEKLLYKDTEGKKSLFASCTLQYESIDQSTLSELNERYPGIEDWFEKEDGVYKPVEKINIGYVLLKHQIYFPEFNGASKTVNFFTLYFGLHTFIA